MPFEDAESQSSCRCQYRGRVEEVSNRKTPRITGWPLGIEVMKLYTWLGVCGYMKPTSLPTKGRPDNGISKVGMMRSTLAKQSYIIFQTLHFRRVRRFFGCRVSPEWVAERKKNIVVLMKSDILSFYLGVWLSHDIGIFIVQPTVTESHRKSIQDHFTKLFQKQTPLQSSIPKQGLEINLTKDLIPQVCLLLLFSKPQ